MRGLKNKIAVVAGATRGAGRGIALALAEQGATVYCTGRSVRGRNVVRSQTRESAFELARRPETIEETAEMATGRGGVGIAVQVDHTAEGPVRALFEQVRREQGRLDVLVNDVWGGDELTEWDKPFWELSLEKRRLIIDRAIFSHVITSHYAAPLMIETGEGLIVEITDGDRMNYRGNLFYDLVKVSVIRLAFAMAQELRRYHIASLALTPGFLRSEAMLDHFGVTEVNWQDGAKQDPNFIASETPFYVGRAVAALAADPGILEKSGKAFSSGGLASDYGFTDIDGSQPNFEKHLESSADERARGFLEEMHRSNAEFLEAFR